MKHFDAMSPSRQWLSSGLAQPVFLILCALCILGAVLRLDQSALWLDEAQTGFVAQGVLATGWPMAYDGRQLIPDPAPYYNEKLLWVEHPWLQFYLVALSFKLFGVNPTSARVPFVLIGLLTGLFLYVTTRRLFGQSVARLAVLLLLTSVPFLLHIRQCRYYAMLCFGTIWALWACLKLEHRERSGILHLTGATVLLFYSNAAYFFAFMIGLTLWMLIFDRRRIDWTHLFMGAGSIAVLTVPWFLYAKLYARRGAYGQNGFLDMLYQLGFYLVDLNNYLLPFACIPLLCVVLDRSSERRRLHVVLLIIPLLLVMRSMVAGFQHAPYVITCLLGGFLFLAMAPWAYWAWDWVALPQHQGRLLLTLVLGTLLGLSCVIPLVNFRYSIGLLPIVFMIAAAVLVAVWRHSKVLGSIGVLCVIGSNLFHSLPFVLIHWLPFTAQDFGPVLRRTTPAGWLARLTGRDSDTVQAKIQPYLASADSLITQSGTLHSPLLDYLYEVTQPYYGPVEGVSAYLQTHAKPGDTFSSDCDAVTLAFHTNLRAVQISIKTEHLTADWISLRPHSFYQTMPTWWVRHFYDEVLTPQYEKIELDYPDLPNIVYHLPDPHFHVFRVDKKAYPKMVIFRRKTDMVRSLEPKEVPR